MPTTQPSINGSLNIFVELKGWDAMVNRMKTALGDRGAIAEPWRDAMEEVASKLAQAAVMGAPLDSGRTISGMYYRVQRQPMPRWVKVGTRARRDQFAYPRFTNYSPYANRYKKTPNRNRFWFDKALISAWNQHIPRILESTARAMEHRWWSPF